MMPRQVRVRVRVCVVMILPMRWRRWRIVVRSPQQPPLTVLSAGVAVRQLAQWVSYMLSAHGHH